MISSLLLHAGAAGTRRGDDRGARIATGGSALLQPPPISEQCHLAHSVSLQTHIHTHLSLLVGPRLQKIGGFLKFHFSQELSRSKPSALPARLQAGSDVSTQAPTLNGGKAARLWCTGGLVQCEIKI